MSGPEGEGQITVPTPTAQLEVGTLQEFLDQWLGTTAAAWTMSTARATRQLGAQTGNIGFLLPAMGKDQLFKTVIFDGGLPRKTFSMGEAHDKRFYWRRGRSSEDDSNQKAKAKINLTLDVLAVREDGYHDIKSVMQTVELCDQVTLTKTEEDGIKVTANVDTVPWTRATLWLQQSEPLRKDRRRSEGWAPSTWRKNIPVAAGIGGGSMMRQPYADLDKLYGTNLRSRS